MSDGSIVSTVVKLLSGTALLAILWLIEASILTKFLYTSRDTPLQSSTHTKLTNTDFLVVMLLLLCVKNVSIVDVGGVGVQPQIATKIMCNRICIDQTPLTNKL
jgi:hypothetical protein